MAKTQSTSAALAIGPVAVDQHCTGEEWNVADIDGLAHLIALISLGQVYQAEFILRGLGVSTPVLGLDVLKVQALALLTVKTDENPWRRDGFLFECISWIAARQTGDNNDYMRDPHLKATTQGLDGLMLRVEHGTLKRATIFEDKCSKDPKGIFSSQVMKAFKSYHSHERAAELLAAAGELLRQAHLKPEQIPVAAASVLLHSLRAYRAALAVSPAVTTTADRADIFLGYDTLSGIKQPQRLAAVLKVPSNDLRLWCEDLAARARTVVAAQSDLSALGISNV